MPKRRPPRAPRETKVLGLPLSAGTFEEVAQAIFAAAREGRAGYVCIANVHMFTLARHSASLAEAIEQAAFVTSDGMPLVWALRRKGVEDAERVAGPDLMDRLCAMAAAASMPVHFFGSTEATLDEMLAELRKRHPALAIAGAEAPPLLPEEPVYDDVVASRLNSGGAGIVFVGLGCPKQERWMAMHAKHAEAIFIGVGAAFDFMAGTVRRAPVWMQRAGLEWLFRLAIQPRKLFKRYLVSNSLFLYYLLRRKL